MPASRSPQHRGGEIWVAPDEHAPELRRARLRGRATVTFTSEMRVRRRSLRQSRLIARPARRGASRRGELGSARFAVEGGEVLEVRP